MIKALTISIVTYNASNEIRECLQSLKRQTFQDFDITIVDNNSSDNTLDQVSLIYPDAKIIRNRENCGFGKAHNQAISKSNSNWILVLNQDVILEDAAIEKMMLKTTDESVASIGLKLFLDSSKTKIDTTGLIKTIYYKVIDRGAGDMPSPDLDKSNWVWGISGACVLYRKSALDRISYGNAQDREYFDEYFFMYKEDIDIAARLQSAGYKSWYQADAIGVHARTGSSSKKRSERPEYISTQSYKNHLYFIFKNASLVALPLITLYEALKLGYLLLFEPRTLRVLPVALRNLPLMYKRRYVSYVSPKLNFYFPNRWS